MPTCQSSKKVFSLSECSLEYRFASAILLRPFQVRKPNKGKSDEPEKSMYEQQVELKKRFKTMLVNEQLIPRVNICGQSP